MRLTVKRLIILLKYKYNNIQGRALRYKNIAVTPIISVHASLPIRSLLINLQKHFLSSSSICMACSNHVSYYINDFTSGK